MTMDKYSQDEDLLAQNLRDEEAQLMQKVGTFMALPEKTASESRELEQTNARLQQVRAKITEIDTKKHRLDSVQEE